MSGIGQSKPRFVRLLSSQIDCVRYDIESSALFVRFNTPKVIGGPSIVYEYSGVPADKALGLICSDSPGHYLHEWIRKGYPFVKHEAMEIEVR